jgi:hypothetical protein
MGQASGTRQLFRTGSYNWVAAPILVALSAVNTDGPLKVLKTTADELDLVNYAVSTRTWHLLIFER